MASLTGKMVDLDHVGLICGLMVHGVPQVELVCSTSPSYGLYIIYITLH